MWPTPLYSGGNARRPGETNAPETEEIRIQWFLKGPLPPPERCGRPGLWPREDTIPGGIQDSPSPTRVRSPGCPGCPPCPCRDGVEPRVSIRDSGTPRFPMGPTVDGRSPLPGALPELAWDGPDNSVTREADISRGILRVFPRGILRRIHKGPRPEFPLPPGPPGWQRPAQVGCPPFPPFPEANGRQEWEVGGQRQRHRILGGPKSFLSSSGMEVWPKPREGMLGWPLESLR